MRAMKTLNSTLAGTWYPGTEREIRAMAETWEKATAKDEAAAPARTNVIVLPHAGWAYSGETAWRAVRAVRGGAFQAGRAGAPCLRSKGALALAPTAPRQVEFVQFAIDGQGGANGKIRSVFQ